MKLRNKKTGEIIEDAQYRNYSTADGFGIRTPTDEYFYKSLKEFFEDWEDYTYREPLIKDEKIRKAVRVWAEACGFSDTEILRVCQGHGCSFIELPASDAQFSLLGVDYGIPYDAYSTIAELCGEEE